MSESLYVSGIPVLVCAYSRRIEFQNLITALVDAGCKRIYINLDGSDHFETQVEQNLMRDFVVRIREGRPDTIFIARQSRENLGAAVSIISSLDWFFSQEEVGLIFEDDLEFDRNIFQFSKWALDCYAHDPEVWMVAGSNFFSDYPQMSGKLHATNYPVTWGWATWAKKWQSIRENILKRPQRYKWFNWNRVSAFWSVGSDRARRGFVDAWDIPLAEAMNRIGAKSVVSPFNLVRNVGFSPLASNTHVLRFPLNRATDSDFDQIDSETHFDFSLIPIDEINTLYENRVYGIQKRHSLSPVFSMFDSIRFRKRARGSLSQRLDKITENSFLEL